jgi:hypothetical protein
MENNIVIPNRVIVEIHLHNCYNNVITLEVSKAFEILASREDVFKVVDRYQNPSSHGVMFIGSYKNCSILIKEEDEKKVQEGVDN